MEHWKQFKQSTPLAAHRWPEKFGNRKDTWCISNLGNIKITYNYNKEDRYITPSTTGGRVDKRYLAISINNANEKYVHRIVATAFIPNPENKRTVNHINGNKLDNNVENLEWATYSENVQHAYNTGLQTKMTPEQRLAAKLKQQEKTKNKRDIIQNKKLAEYNKILDELTYQYEHVKFPKYQKYKKVLELANILKYKDICKVLGVSRSYINRSIALENAISLGTVKKPNWFIKENNN
tara:strand:- start:4336 stop:5046 length:711 start_codon:yes stop_codon:yes gene_type:complete